MNDENSMDNNHHYTCISLSKEIYSAFGCVIDGDITPRGFDELISLREHAWNDEIWVSKNGLYLPLLNAAQAVGIIDIVKESYCSMCWVFILSSEEILDMRAMSDL